MPHPVAQCLMYLPGVMSVLVGIGEDDLASRCGLRRKRTCQSHFQTQKNAMLLSLLLLIPFLLAYSFHDRLPRFFSVQTFCRETAQQGDGIQEEEAGDYRAEHGSCSGQRRS